MLGVAHALLIILPESTRWGSFHTASIIILNGACTYPAAYLSTFFSSAVSMGISMRQHSVIRSE